jgi:hypothetical protein
MSSSSQTYVKRQRGFEEKDVRRFLQSGNLLSTTTSKDGFNIGNLKPKEKEFVTQKATYKRGGFLGMGTPTKEVSYQNTPDFSKFGQADIDSIAEIFMNRQRSIQQKRLAPGRSALFLGGR